MSQTISNTATTTTDLFTAASNLPKPVCVTAFITPQSLIELNIYSDGTKSIAEGEAVAPAVISVGTYMSDRSIWHICNFTNAANALNYAFMLKGENCPISKNAFALLKAEIKRTGAISNRAKARAEAKEQAQPEVKPEVEDNKPQNIKSSDSPLLKQYKDMKKKHPDAILLFRIGDFYEVFEEDAKITSDILGITLTTRAHRNNKTLLAGFPHHALDTYLPKLVRAGHRVAICEQVETPLKKIVKRDKKA